MIFNHTKLYISLIFIGITIFTSGFWFKPKEMEFASIEDMHMPRAAHKSILLNNGLVLLIGSSLMVKCDDFMELFNPQTNKFEITEKLIDCPRREYTATLLKNNKVLIIGGGYHNGELKSSTELYDLNKKTIKLSSNLIYPRYGHTANLLNDGRIIVLGGAVGYKNALVEIYNPLIDKFELIAKMNKKRLFPSSITLNDGRVLIIGGYYDGKFKSSTEIYNPKTNKFDLAGKLNIPRSRAQLFLTSNGKVLVLGGQTAKNDFALNVEVYDPKTNEFTLIKTQIPIKGLHYYQVNLLSDDRILVSGGRTKSPPFPKWHNKTYIFDYKTSTWEKGPKMKSKRAFHSAVLLKNGDVLITGGDKKLGNESLKKAEILKVNKGE